MLSSLSLFASNSRRTRRLSLLPVVNKQICLSLGIQHRFRLGEHRAAAREEATTARHGLSSARGGWTKGIYDVHLSSHYLPYFLSFPFASPSWDNPGAFFPRFLVTPSSSFHILFLHSSLSSPSRDSPFYSSSFCLNPFVYRMPYRNRKRILG